MLLVDRPLHTLHKQFWFHVGIVLVMTVLGSAWIRRFPVKRWHGNVHGTFGSHRSIRFFGDNRDSQQEWHGDMTPFSEYAMHVLVDQQDIPVTVQEAISRSMGTKVARGESPCVPFTITALTPPQLLQLGSIWYLPRSQHEQNQQGVLHSFYKPMRLSLPNLTMDLQEGDYLRIHHTPRRFPAVYNFSWTTAPHQEESTIVGSATTLPSVIVHSQSDFWIIDKPPLIPVHATVDNQVENVVHQLAVANPDTDYVTTTQRIDINTSGLLVVAKKLEFASYFAQLLRHKTKHGQADTIVKRYTCLVCLQPTDKDSVVEQWQRLASLVNTTIRHFLEPSDRAPKRFESEPPPLEDDNNHNSKKEWLQCLLKITNISSIHPIPNDQHFLAQQLWTSALMPPSTKAVCEVSIQLETGRTHQIRGQLSKLGYPLVGDEQYGGAIPVELSSDTGSSDTDSTLQQQPQQQQLLALQSSYIGFWDADYTQVWNRRRRTNITQGIPSDRWIETNLERAWWTPILEQQGPEEEESTTSVTDVKLLQTIQSATATKSLESSDSSHTSSKRENLELLPPPVQLSPGRNKYVLVKVESRTGEMYWFVKSASPLESGGPYHANVAKDLVEWIQVAGYQKITVTGGGRIDYDPSSNRAHIYGFSYGFGKGDHALAAALIAKAGILSTYDNTNALY